MSEHIKFTQAEFEAIKAACAGLPLQLKQKLKDVLLHHTDRERRKYIGPSTTVWLMVSGELHHLNYQSAPVRAISVAVGDIQTVMQLKKDGEFWTDEEVAGLGNSIYTGIPKP